MSASTDAHWIHCQEVISGKYFWLHSKTHEIRSNEPSETNGNDTKTPISRRGTLTITKTLPKRKSSAPPPPPKKDKRKKAWPFKKKKRSQTDGSIDTNNDNHTLPNYTVLHSNNSNDAKKKSPPRRMRAQSTTDGAKPNHTKRVSKYDIEWNADKDFILNALIGYNVLDINDCVAGNEYIKSDINSFLLYKYQSICMSHVKAFAPPLNHKYNEMKYFRNIQYPQYKLDTNLKIQQIINQNIYYNQTPYLRIRIPINISLNIFKLKNPQKTEIFNIELSKQNVLNTTVSQFFHSITKQSSSLRNEEEIKRMFLSHSVLDEKQNMDSDWSKLAIKANELEEYIFYSTDMNDKICNYECIRYALSHQLDKMNDNKSFLSLVYLHDFHHKIANLKIKYIDYTKYLSVYKKYIQNTCNIKQQFSTNYPWLNAINKQFFSEQNENNNIYEWKKKYDIKYPQNNIVFLSDYKCCFEYTIHSIINYHKLSRFVANKHKYSSITISFELQIGNISYAQDIWLTAPKNITDKKIVFKKAIYKSKHLKINTFPREVILSIIVFGIPHTTKDSDIYSVIYSAKSSDHIVPEWFLGTRANNADHKLLKEEAMSIDGEMKHSVNEAAPTATRRRQYSYGSVEEDKEEHNEDIYGAKGVFYNAFNGCQALGYLRIPLIDDFHSYRQGTLTLNMWDIPLWKESKHSPSDPYAANLLWRFLKPCSLPPSNSNQCQITITIGPNPENNPNYLPCKAIAPLFNPMIECERERQKVVGKAKQQFSTSDYKKMDLIVRRDPLTPLSGEDKYFIWISREKLSKTKPRALPVFLSCIDWRNPYFRSEAYKYMYKWKLSASSNRTDLVELLCSWRYFPDNRIKHYVVTKGLNQLSDMKIKHILLQLVQILKLEPHNFSFVSYFLVRRALRSVTRIGHYLYWYLFSEMDASHCSYSRLSLILEDFLVHCFDYPAKLCLQQQIVAALKEVSRIVQKGKRDKQPGNELKLRMQHILRRINKSMMEIKAGISLPLNPKYRLKQLDVGKCKFMGSAQAPLWLEFVNCDQHCSSMRTKVLFKCGDDLRQDLLTLQIMDAMNELWLISGYCMRLRLYKVIATGRNCGFIQIVGDSRTFDDLSVNLGGGIVRGPKDETVHVKYLKSVHSDNGILMAQDRYLRSCAGYCIASWILGIGDRHSDNLMVHDCGDLFHIDFGHFLGHFKVKKFEISKKVTFEWKRERSPFVFLPAMKYCIKYDFKNNKVGSDDEQNANYQKFVALCTTAMDAIKRKQRLLINLFILMLPSQMPELLAIADIVYMRNQINNCTATENYDEIRKYVCKQLDNSFNDGVRILDHIAHAWVHSK